jgi:hypothetical protein
MGEDKTVLTLTERERVVQRLLALADLLARVASGPVDREALVMAAVEAKIDAEALMKGAFHAPEVPTEDRAIIGGTP